MPALRPNPILPGGAVAIIDRFLGQMRDETCTIWRPGTSRDSGGAPVTGGFVQEGDAVTCRVVRAGTASNETVQGERLTSEADYEVRLPRDTIVDEKWQIEYRGQRLEVVSPENFATHGMELSVPVVVAT